MKKIQRKEIGLFAAQVILVSLIVLSPGLISFVTSNDAAVAWESLRISSFWLAPALVVYLLNFYLCVPLLWFRHRFWLFSLANALLIVVFNFHLFNLFSESTNNLPVTYRAGFSSMLIIVLLVNLMAIAFAVSIRYIMRQSEKKQKEVEAELAWLKNQINPHFLFNTLNNISSLTQVDADEAQDAVMQLSDLLRYAMYETNKKKVPISGEINFMRNYIELMKLRCNEKTHVSFRTMVPQPDMEIAPLLFISLVENAFKHGVDGSKEAEIDISLMQEDHQITFTCDNTNNPKPAIDRSGSGIGLDNTRRRLELLYPGRYQWEQHVTPENIYHVRIIISDK